MARVPFNSLSGATISAFELATREDLNGRPLTNQSGTQAFLGLALGAAFVVVPMLADAPEMEFPLAKGGPESGPLGSDPCPAAEGGATMAANISKSAQAAFRDLPVTPATDFRYGFVESDGTIRLLAQDRAKGLIGHVDFVRQGVVDGSSEGFLLGFQNGKVTFISPFSGINGAGMGGNISDEALNGLKALPGGDTARIVHQPQ